MLYQTSSLVNTISSLPFKRSGEGEGDRAVARALIGSRGEYSHFRVMPD